MCGIVAHVAGGARPVEPEQIETRSHRLRHRGPDGSGVHVAGRVGVGHRRLSIIDVEGGRQPLLDEDGRVALVCNGEIYNHRALRERLAGRHTFRSLSDCEVILHLYQDLGPACVRELDGMFAFVLTDGDEVLAARDAFGIKPLYLARDGVGGLWFVSELKSLPPGCGEVEEFPPGHAWTRRGGFERWFQPAWTEPPGDPAAASPADIAERFEAAVVKRLMSDVPLGVFLSGGLDSSLVAAVVRRYVDDLHTFAVGIEGSPDLVAARVVATHLGTRHHEYVYTPREVVEALETVVWHLESYDPALIRSAVPCFFVSRLAAEHVKVVLAGEGSDEVFAGYGYFGEASGPSALHRETARLLLGLHNMNLQRTDRMTMAHSIEGRVPFLDAAFVDAMMQVDPARKLHGPGRPEKALLRDAFEGWLPDSILWRAKQEFAEGCGSEGTLREHFEHRVAPEALASASTRFPEDPPASAEALHYRHVFEGMFPGPAARATVGRWRGAWQGEARSEGLGHA